MFARLTILIFALSTCGCSIFKTKSNSDSTGGFYIDSSGRPILYGSGRMSGPIGRAPWDDMKSIERKLPRVQFATGNSSIDQKSESAIRSIDSLLNAKPTLRISIDGHTDDRETKFFDHAMQLSFERARN